MTNSVPPPAISQLVSAASPHPKPCPKPHPVFLPSTVDKHPDQFSQLGHSWPWIPSDILPMPSSATVPSPTASMTSIHASTAISTPAPSLMSALKLWAAIEKEAKAIAVMKASINSWHQHVALINPPVVSNTALSTVEPILTMVASSLLLL